MGPKAERVCWTLSPRHWGGGVSSSSATLRKSVVWGGRDPPRHKKSQSSCMACTGLGVSSADNSQEWAPPARDLNIMKLLCPEESIHPDPQCCLLSPAAALKRPLLSHHRPPANLFLERPGTDLGRTVCMPTCRRCHCIWLSFASGRKREQSSSLPGNEDGSGKLP